MRLQRIAAWISQGVHCVVFGGHHDLTLSARCFVEYRVIGNDSWRWGYLAFNAAFFWQEDHCRSSFLADIEFAEMVLHWRDQYTGYGVVE
jgi:hypothetical protein